MFVPNWNKPPSPAPVRDKANLVLKESVIGCLFLIDNLAHMCKRQPKGESMLTRRNFIGALGIASAGIVLGLPGCGPTASKTPTYGLNDTVSSDIIDFTLHRATLAYYADGSTSKLGLVSTGRVTNADTAYLPIESESESLLPYAANKGRVLICLEFTVKNNDRATLDIGGTFSDWLGQDITATYQDKDYPIKSYDSHDIDGDVFGINLSHSIYSKDEGATWFANNSRNYMLKADNAITLRLVCIAGFEPTSLTDTYQLKVDILNSKKESDQFVFEIS